MLEIASQPVQLEMGTQIKGGRKESGGVGRRQST